MYDLHSHSLLSDGQLLPSEIARRYKALGYKAAAITDHVDASNIDSVVPMLAAVCGNLSRYAGIIMIPGAEITHAPISQLGALVKKARSLGAKLVVAHGETLAEPVAPGTNRKALQCGIDILAHPGLLTERDARLAAKNGVFLEITTRRGHAFTNGYVAKMARMAGAKLVLNSDSHAPEDLITPAFAERLALGAGLTKAEVALMRNNAKRLVEKVSS